MVDTKKISKLKIMLRISITIIILNILRLPLLQAQDIRQRFLEESLLINEPRGNWWRISLRLSPQDSVWSDWQRRTGELPPDFSKMPSIPDLPDPLQLPNGKVTTPEQWHREKHQIRELYEYWVSGHRPPAPESFRSTVLSERIENGVKIQIIELRFGPKDQAKMTLELMIPPGKGPFPVYMTQWNHRNWGQLAVRRGYIACMYAAADTKDDTQAYQEIYPEYDFACIMRRAWGASRTVDYLMTRHEINHAQIAITGLSRNGKQTLMAAAFDERFAAAVSLSCGTGGITPWRYSDPKYCNQSLDDLTSNAAHWFHPRLRFFFGREDKLPVDQNMLLSLIAPRALLLHYATVERQLNPWVCEQTYRSVKTVYSLLNAEEKIGVFPRYGEHAAMTRDLEQCIDFLDIQFGRKQGKWTNELYYDFSFDKWKENSLCRFNRPDNYVEIAEKETKTSIESKKTLVRDNLTMLLGEKPAMVRPAEIKTTNAAQMDWINLIIGKPQVKNAQRIHIGPYYATMGDHLSSYLYCPEAVDRNQKIPVILFLHQYSYNHGFAYGYKSFNCSDNNELFQYFIDNGFAVMAIDMLGFSTRIEEGSRFYDRFPCWSKMGQMVADVDACIDAIGGFDFLDSNKVFIIGNTIGGTVALLATALNEKIAGVAVLSGISPWRDASTQYLNEMSNLHGFIPRLGFWLDQPAQVPVDFPEIMTCIAPRPLMVISPSLDRHVKLSQVEYPMEKVKNIYTSLGYPKNIRFETPVEISRFTNDMRDNAIKFFKEHL